jgi:hypothetical protein
MEFDRFVIVYPPDETGGRRVRVDGKILGRAFGLRDVLAFLQEAGFQDWDEDDVVRSSLIEWRGGGPEDWAAPS